MSIQTAIAVYSRTVLAILLAIFLSVLWASNATAAVATTTVPYFSDNFDNGQKNKANGFSWAVADSRVSVSSTYAYSGQYSLQFSYGPDADGKDSFAEQRFNIAPDAASAPAEMWIQYMWRVPKNFTLREPLPNNNKLVSFFAEKYSTEGDIQTTFEYERTTATSAHLRSLCMSNSHCRPGTDYSGKKHVDVVVSSMMGQWTRMRIHVKSGTPGAIEIWRDNSLVYTNYDLDLTYTGGNNYFRHGYIMGWSNTGFAEVTNFYVDDFTVYTTNPGWDGSSSQTDGSSSQAAPNPPKVQ